MNNSFINQFNSLGIVFTNQSSVATNANTGWLLPIGTYKIEYKNMYGNGTYNNRMGVRTIAIFNGVEYIPSLCIRYTGRFQNILPFGETSASFIYDATVSTYMRISSTISKNNATFGVDTWTNTQRVRGANVIITKLD